MFRLTAGVRDWSGVASNDPSVTLIGQAVNAVVSTVLWAYLASIAILLGGELDAALRARRARLGPQREILREAVGGGAVLRRADALAQVGEDVAQQHVVLPRRLRARRASSATTSRYLTGARASARAKWPARNSVVPRASPV